MNNILNIINKTIFFSFQKETMLVSLINFLIVTNIFFHKSKITMIPNVIHPIIEN